MTSDLVRVGLVVTIVLSAAALIVPVTLAKRFDRWMAPSDPHRAEAALRAMYPHMVMQRTFDMSEPA